MPGVVEDDFVRSTGTRQRSGVNLMHETHNIDNMKGGSRNRYPNGYSSDQMSDITDDGPRYLLEHLATFSVGNEFGLVSPKDGLRRLLQMEKTSGIWTQKMQMKLDKNWVLILDYEDGDVVEKFPMNLIADPTAYTSEDPRELYNNILVFIVREDPKSKNPNQSEMHIFQCARVYAQDVVDEMKMFMSGKVKPKNSENIRHLPPPPHNPPPEPPVNGSNMKVREQVAMFTSSGSSAMHPPPPRGPSILQQRIERASGYARESNDETSSTTSDKYEREVTILNHCFDDIERFVVRLQHAAAAFKELERRQKSRKHKKKDMGDGMLSIRAKPPPEREFVDVLQKFKLSFNLLAKLKSHIHDPNAPELVHFLFTPLALIVDAARDSMHSANLAANVVSPLLSRDAIELLGNCCTSKETDLWHSLGDSWIIPREQWKGYESNYRPVFSNGWAPENPLEDAAGNPRRPEGDLREQDYQRVFSHQERESRYGSEYFGSEREDHERNESPGIVPDHPHMRPYERPYEHMPPEARREFLDRGNMIPPEPDFHDPRDRDMRSEFSSDSIEHSDLPLSPERQFDRQQLQWLEDLKNRRAKIVQVVYPRTANNEKELTVIRGEVLEVIDDSRKWWKARNMRGQVAHVPHTIVTPFASADDDIFNNPVYGSRGSRENYYSTDGSPLKDQYPEGTTRSQDTSRSPSSGMSRPAPADWVRRERQGNADVSKSSAPDSTSSGISISEDEGLPLPSPPSEQTTFSSPMSQDTSFSPPNWLPPPPDVPIYTEPYGSLNRPQSIIPVKAKEELQAKRSSLVRKHSSGKHQQPQQTYSESDRIGGCGRTQSLSDDLVGKRSSSDAASIASTETVIEMFREELRASLAQKKGQKVWRKITCPEHGITDCFYITLHSAKEEVEHWLKIKGFSGRACDILTTMSVDTLFNLKKSQLEKHLGSEGAKLHSNLLLQKNLCGYKTATSQELKHILEERRQRVESF